MEPAASASLLAALFDGALIVGPDGRIVAANAAALSLLRVPDPLGHPLAALLTGAASRLVTREAALAGGERLVVLRDERGRDELERLKDELLATISHELRTPLTSLIGALALMAKGRLGPLPPQAERLIGIAHESAERLARLINDMLELEAVEAGEVRLVLAPCELSGLVAAVADSLRETAERAGVGLVVDGAEAWGLADAEWLGRVVRHVLHNAVRFSPAGAVVRLSLTGGPAEVTVAVHNAGGGIPAEQLEGIFERFRQGDGSDTRRSGGAGLGLALSRGIMSLHGGRIWAESAPGQGATFFFSVPSAAAPSSVA